MSDVKTITRVVEAPPGSPVDTSPPEPIETTPRTEGADWIWVNYLTTHGLKFDGKPNEQRVTDARAIPATVAAVLARDAANAAYPFIWLAAELGPAFEDAYVATKVSAVRAEYGGAAAAWNAVIDFAPLAPLRAATNKDDPTDADWEAYTTAHENLSPDPAVARWLNDIWYADEPELPRDGQSPAQLLETWMRDEVRWRLYPFGKWRVLLGKRGADRYEIASGGIVYPARVYRALEERLQKFQNSHVLPIAAERFVAFLRERHGDWCEAHGDLNCGGFPSDRTIAKFLQDGGIKDPELPKTPPPPSAAALLAGRGTLVGPTPLLAYLAWPGRTTLFAAREKDGKSTLVGDAVAALTRGRAWLGQPTMPVNVLWLTEEPTDDVLARFQRFDADMERVFPIVLPLADRERDLVSAVASLTPRLVVVDSLIRYQGGAVGQDTSAVQWERVLTPLNAIAHAPGGPGLVVLHHAGKKDGEYRDSTEIGAFCDMLVQQPARLKSGRQTLEGIGRITGVTPYVVTIELVGDAHRLITGVETRTEDLTENERTALDALRQLVPDATASAVSSKTWSDTARLSNDTAFDRARESLIEQRDLVERIGRKGERGQTFRPKVQGSNEPKIA